MKKKLISITLSFEDDFNKKLLKCWSILKNQFNGFKNKTLLLLAKLSTCLCAVFAVIVAIISQKEIIKLDIETIMVILIWYIR